MKDECELYNVYNVYAKSYSRIDNKLKNKIKVVKSAHLVTQKGHL
jgi:hypothetical protein